jgi:hypothetical protein
MLPLDHKGKSLYAVIRRSDGALRLITSAFTVQEARAQAAAHPALAGETLDVVRATEDHAFRWVSGESLYHDPEPQPKETRVYDTNRVRHVFRVPRSPMFLYRSPATWLCDVFARLADIDDDLLDYDRFDAQDLTSQPIDGWQSFYEVAVEGEERTLRLVCMLFNQHAGQSPDDPTPWAEAERLDAALARAKSIPTITVAELRDLLDGYPAGLPVTIAQPDGSGWFNLRGAANDPDSSGEEMSLILATTDDFDPRQW